MTDNRERKRYEIEIVRELRKTVTIDAASMPDATSAAYDMAEAEEQSGMFDNGYQSKRMIKVTEVNDDNR